KKTREDGSRVFTTRVPRDAKGKLIEPKRGAVKCLLHADGPNRAEYDALGFAVCGKPNLTSPFQLRRHMQVRHKVEWSTIEEERQRKEKEEERAFQRSIVKMASASK
ncbi:MAG: hypothetical protein Q7J84_07450, partial [Sulfuricaulis sp.]|nr:hypothetical protein [Sulfuricaulis sp.]